MIISFAYPLGIMEAFALLKIEKNKKIAAEKEALEKHRIAERTIKSTKQSVSIDESKRLVRSLNQCIPPDGVYAIGSENSAAVWWTHSTDDRLCTTWEIHRYRKDLGEWNYKGMLRIDAIDLAGRNQTIVPHLSNDKEYKFFIKACNDSGEA